MIKTNNLSKVFYEGRSNEIVALKEINIEIQKGDFCTIVGPSGSGKTTFLKCISGLECISSGEILVDGNDIQSFNEEEVSFFRRKKIAFIFQEYNLIEDLTLYENICLDQNIREEVNHLIDLWKIRHVIDLFPNQCSGGQQQKCAILRALNKDVDIIFCDEPTGALDGKSTKDVFEVLQMVQREYKKTIVLITHNILVMNISTCVVKIHDGEIADYYSNANIKNAGDLEW